MWLYKSCDYQCTILEEKQSKCKFGVIYIERRKKEKKKQRKENIGYDM